MILILKEDYAISSVMQEPIREIQESIAFILDSHSLLCEIAARHTETKPRIAPILLWPIKIDMENRDRISILFDRDREEVRVKSSSYRTYWARRGQKMGRNC